MTRDECHISYPHLGTSCVRRLYSLRFLRDELSHLVWQKEGVGHRHRERDVRQQLPRSSCQRQHLQK